MPKHRFFVSPEQICAGLVRVQGEDARQIRVVLRMRPDDEIGVLDGSGREYLCVLTEIGQHEVLAQIMSVRDVDVEPTIHITVVQAVAKGEKIERVIQHGTEIGVSRFLIVQTERSVVRLDEDRLHLRVERWRRIAKEAAEQAHRARVPCVEGYLSLRAALQEVRAIHTALLHPDDNARSLVEWITEAPQSDQLAVLVGPEGGWTPQEVTLCRIHGATPVSLMSRVLRTETAALVAVSQMLLSGHLVRQRSVD